MNELFNSILMALLTTLGGFCVYIFKEIKDEIKYLTLSVNEVNEKLARFIVIVEKHEDEILDLKKNSENLKKIKNIF